MKFILCNVLLINQASVDEESSAKIERIGFYKYLIEKFSSLKVLQENSKIRFLLNITHQSSHEKIAIYI